MTEIYGINRYILTIDNPINLMYNEHTHETNNKLIWDPPKLSGWDIFWKDTFNWYNNLHWDWKGKVGVTFILGGLAATVLSGGTILPALSVMAKTAGISMALSIGIESTIGGIGGGMDGAPHGAIDSAVEGFMWGEIFSSTSQIISSIYRDQALNYLRANGVIKAEIIQNIRAFNGVPRLKKLGIETTVYRTWGLGLAGSGSKMIGRWVSPVNYGSTAKSMLSLPPWNTAVNTSSFVIPAGTRVLTGTVAAQPLWGQAGGGIQWWLTLWSLI